jgi:hypothetical protein
VRRYEGTVAFFIDAADDGEAHSLISNFIDSFPAEMDSSRAPDVMVQDVVDAGEPAGDGADAETTA